MMLLTVTVHKRQASGRGCANDEQQWVDFGWHVETVCIARREQRVYFGLGSSPTSSTEPESAP